MSPRDIQAVPGAQPTRCTRKRERGKRRDRAGAPLLPLAGEGWDEGLVLVIIGLVPFALSAALAVAAQAPDLSYTPLRAPLLADLCSTPEDAELAERRTSFCAGYVRAILENDPRLGECRPLLPAVIEDIKARQRMGPLTDNNVLARDFVVDAARDLCPLAPPDPGLRRGDGLGKPS